MTGPIFGSKSPDWLNNDPHPCVRPSDGARGSAYMEANLLPGQSGPFGVIEQLLYDPRPEFTPALTHPHNPVLHNIRVAKFDATDIDEFIDASISHLKAGADPGDDPAHVAHALAVITKWKKVRRANRPTLILASQWDEDLNLDPTPWVDAFGERFSEQGIFTGPVRYYRPREEFVPTITHDTNPILADFRDFTGFTYEWLTYLDEPAEQKRNGEPWTPEQVEHARRVLTRLHAWREAHEPIKQEQDA
ncbi:hypothetical protein [Leifsonia sp. Leaf264]|uniref:hypothetical protein n=1 Tax=Leifsonia sp. Leaf264 TaxID=1736314 RepID=UPI0006FDF2AE|nr:hypothetical protein [Leifsonia sp. Leaf264]KQO98461.1 hypothetical protein ASF30_10390 [Leifsonia sp. Leaf264]